MTKIIKKLKARWASQKSKRGILRLLKVVRENWPKSQIIITEADIKSYLEDRTWN
ncbi:MAG: hypothetical protein V1720_15755 [bacterium]